MRFIRKFWREILCTLSFSIFLHIGLITINNPPETISGQSIIIVLGFATFAAFAWLLRELWRKKWKKRFVRLTQRAMEKLSAFFMRFVQKILQKYNIGGKHRKNILGGSAKITFDSNIFENKATTRPKRLKWKNLQSDRERLGFLYRQIINAKIKTGTRVYACDTPSELLDRVQSNEIEKEVFDLYIDTRYDDRAILSSDRVSELKERLETK